MPPRTRTTTKPPADETVAEVEVEAVAAAVAKLSTEELEARIADLEAQLAALPATGDRPRNVVEAIVAVMNEVRAVGKDGRNEQQGFNFRGIDGVLNAVGPALRKHGVMCFPADRSYSTEEVEVGQRRTKMAHVLLDVTYRFAYSNNAGDITTLDAIVTGEAMDSGDKCMSKAFSVAYRTCLIQTLSLPTTEKDPDADTYERSEGPDPAVLEQLRAKVEHLFTLPLDQVRAAAEPLTADEETRALLEHVTVTVDGNTGGALAALRHLAQKVTAAEANAAAVAQDSAAEGQTAQVDEQAERAQQAKAHADAEADKAAASPGPRDRKAQMIALAGAEVEAYATILGMSEDQLLARVCEHHKVSTMAEVPMMGQYGLGAFLVSLRPGVIKRLQETGRAHEADSLARAGDTWPARVEDLLGARTDEVPVSDPLA